MKARILVVIAALSLLGGCVVEPAAPAPAERVVIRVPPPPEVVEALPPLRPNYVWARGYWHWNGERHVWVAGHWEPARVGYHYEHPHWERHGEEWHFSGGVWLRD